ncbi:MAG: BatD family protein, partial [Elusimicrobia bacterium]|nr:BatD family protein [Elusimicrobiota bacterium]
RPAGFKGDVGQYKITAALDKTEAHVYEPVTLTVTVSGDGNIKTLSTPPIPSLDGFKTYETLSSLNVSKNSGRVRGSKIFTTILKPDVSGRWEIPPIPFRFFDPTSKTYKEIRTSPLSLFVRPSRSGEETLPPASPSTASEGVQLIGQDIRFIKNHGRLKQRKTPGAGPGAWLFFNLVPGLGFIGLWGLKSYRARLLLNPAGFAFRRAYKRAHSGLQAARALLRQKDVPGYYAQLQKVMLHYLGDKMSLPPHGLVWERVEEDLRNRKTAEDLQQEIRRLWSDFDQARFAPSLLTQTEAERHGMRLAALLRALEPGWRS